MRRYGILVVAVVVAATCVRLGMWQLDRLAERQARNVILRNRLAMPPIDLPAAAVPDSLHLRRALATGVFDFERQVILTARSSRGVPGVHVVTPLGLGDGTAVLVERGWAPSPDGRTVALDAFAEPDTVKVMGLLLQDPARAAPSGGQNWPVFVRSLNARELAARYPYPLFPGVLRRTEATRGVPRELRALAVPELSNGPHLSYALQWFSFALIALVGSAVVVWRSRREEPQDGPPST